MVIQKLKAGWRMAGARIVRVENPHSPSEILAKRGKRPRCKNMPFLKRPTAIKKVQP